MEATQRVHAIELQRRLAEDQDTDVDELDGTPRRIRLRPRRDDAEEGSDPGADRVDGGVATAAPPVQSGRLDEVRIRETIARRCLATPQSPPPDRSASSAFGIEFARSHDLSQTIVASGDSIEVRGIATGLAAPVPGARFGRPVTLAVAVDGLLYAVRLAPGDTAGETAERLADKLAGRFEVELTSASDAHGSLRLVGLRAAALA